MIKFFPSEQFKEIILEDPLKFRYAISNYGRLISFTDSFENGRLLKGSPVDGYKTFSYKLRKGDRLLNKHLFLYKLVAQYFLPKSSDDQTFVLHLDHNRGNDYIDNLKWATRQEMLGHSKKSPYVLEAKRKLVEFNIKSDGHKLTSTQVMLLKKRLLDPNRKTRLKILAKMFGVSEMQLQRIKTGENWGHIKVDN